MLEIHVFGDNAVVVDTEMFSKLSLGDRKPDKILEYNKENLEIYGLSSDHTPKKSVVQSNK